MVMHPLTHASREGEHRGDGEGRTRTRRTGTEGRPEARRRHARWRLLYVPDGDTGRTRAVWVGSRTPVGSALQPPTRRTPVHLHREEGLL